MTMRALVSFAMGAALVGGCSTVPLTAAQQEANLVARVIEAAPRARYTVTRHVEVNHGPSLVVVRYQIDGLDPPRRLDIACSDRTSPPCWVVGTPPLDLGAPSLVAAELVALVGAVNWMMACGEVSSVESIDGQRNPHFGSTFVVRACGRKSAFDVSCDTRDPQRAAKECRVTGKNAVVEFNASAHPDLRFRRCANNLGYGVLEPASPMSGDELLDGAKELSAYFGAVPVVRRVERRECCTDETPPLPCLAVFVTPRVNADDALDAVATALSAYPGARPRVVVHNATLVGAQ